MPEEFRDAIAVTFALDKLHHIGLAELVKRNFDPIPDDIELCSSIKCRVVSDHRLDVKLVIQDEKKGDYYTSERTYSGTPFVVVWKPGDEYA